MTFGNLVLNGVAVPFIGNDGELHYKEVFLDGMISQDGFPIFKSDLRIYEMVTRIYLLLQNPTSGKITNQPGLTGYNVIPFPDVVKCSINIDVPLPPEYGFKISPEQINVGVVSFIYDEGYSPIQFINWKTSYFLAPAGPSNGVVVALKPNVSGSINMYQSSSAGNRNAILLNDPNDSFVFTPYDSQGTFFDVHPGLPPPIVD